MPRSITHIADPYTIACIIAEAERIGATPIIELLRPAMAGKHTLIMPQRETRLLPFRRAEKARLPTITVVGDDDYEPAGPATWASAAKLRAWAHFAIVHGTGAKKEHYVMAADLTRRWHRVLFIETTCAAAQDWAAFLLERSPRLEFMGILPPDGVHPVMPGRADLH